MKRLLLASFLIIGSTGTMLAKVAEMPIPNPHSGNCPKLVAEMPIPNPHSGNCPKLAS